MEDNDLRGFLDGRYCWAWNQPGQTHLRVGRVGPDRIASPRYGEHELFRVLLLWDRIELPALACVERARLAFTVEEGPARPLHLLVYTVRRDWNPGRGGTERNNVSVPRAGEVWWNEAAREADAWGLPGASFASGRRPDADIDAMPLASALCHPEQSQVVFEGPRLARYVTDRARAGEPLRFLLRISGYEEDVPGNQLSLYSGNYGDSRNLSRRPEVILEWKSPAERRYIEEYVTLEYGRSHVVGHVPVRPGSWCAVTFHPEPGSLDPTLQVRERSDDRPGRWRSCTNPFRAESDRLEVRLVAAIDPVPLGSPFTAELEDTWVVSGPPEDQVVEWRFVSPTGRKHRVRAAYSGAYRWGVKFEPDEPGRWRYTWTHRLKGRPCTSSEGRFDVLAEELSPVRVRLEELARELETSEIQPDELPVARVRFARLQSSAMGLQTPESFRSEVGDQLRQLFNRIRSGLWGRRVPDVIPLESHPTRRGGRAADAADDVGDPFPTVSPRWGGPAEADRSPGESNTKENGLRMIRKISYRLLQVLSRWAG